MTKKCNNNSYRNLSNYLSVLPTSVAGPKLPVGTPDQRIQQVAVDHLNFRYEALTHGNASLSDNNYFTIDNAYPAASQHLCSSYVDVVCPYNTLSKRQQNYMVKDPYHQVADVTNAPVSLERGVFKNPAVAESWANNVGYRCSLGSQGHGACAQSNTPTDYRTVASCQSTGCGR